MIDGMDSAQEPIRFNARTGLGVLIQAGIIAAATALLGVSTAVGYGWDGWLLAIPLVAIVVILVPVFATATEWTVAGDVLSSRRWYSWPGRAPSPVAQLGPHLGIAHEGRYRWRLQPYGPAIYVQQWRTQALIGAMQRAGVHVDDWRGQWALRHRLLDRAGVAIQFVAAAGMFVAIALGGTLRPFGFVTFWVSMAGMVASLAIDYLPWKRRKTAGRDGELAS